MDWLAATPDGDTMFASTYGVAAVKKGLKVIEGNREQMEWRLLEAIVTGDPCFEFNGTIEAGGRRQATPHFSRAIAPA